MQVFDSRDYYVLTPSDEYVDLYHFAQLVNGSSITNTAVKLAAQEVMTTVNQAVVVERHQSGQAAGSYWNLDNAHGLSVYFPRQSGGWDYYNYINPQTPTTVWQFTSQTAWDEFLKRYFSVVALPSDPGGYGGLGELLTPHHKVYLPLVWR